MRIIAKNSFVEVFKTLSNLGYSNPIYFDILNVIAAVDANGDVKLFDNTGAELNCQGVNIKEEDGNVTLIKGSYSVTFEKYPNV